LDAESTTEAVMIDENGSGKRVHSIARHGPTVILITSTIAAIALLLATSHGDAAPPPEIQQKLEHLQPRIQAWLEAGGDPRVIQPLGEELGDLLESGSPEEIEAQIDAIEAVIEAPAARSNADARQSAVDRARRLEDLQRRIDAWVEAGGDPREVLPLGRELREYQIRGETEMVDAQIERILAVISKAPKQAPEASPSTLRTISDPVALHVRAIPKDAEIVFYSDRHGPFEIFTMTSRGSGVTQITFRHPQRYEHVAVSFDHRWIATDRYLEGSGPTGLWVIDIERGVEFRLVPDFFAAGGGGVDWSPDGFIYFGGWATPREGGIFRIRPDGSGLEKRIAIEPPERGLGDVSVSDDGSLLAYVRTVSVKGERKAQIWVARSDGSERRMVDNGGPESGDHGGFPIGDYDPEISSDNNFVVFSRTNTEHVNFAGTFLNTAHDLWVAPIDGSGPARRITEPGPVSIIPDWRGDEVIYTEYNEKAGYVGLSTVRSDGSGYRRLEHGLRVMWSGGRHGKWIPQPAAEPAATTKSTGAEP
jgi:hypothetical protein